MSQAPYSPGYPPQPQPYPPPQQQYPPTAGPHPPYPAPQGPYQPYPQGPPQGYGYPYTATPAPQNIGYTERTVDIVNDNQRHQQDDTADQCCLMAMCALCLCCFLSN